jgi:hypothetical protein
MKKYCNILFLLSTLCLYSQSLKYGKYISELKGTILLNKGNSFIYKKQHRSKNSNLTSWLEQSCGTFKVKNNFLVFNSNENPNNCPDSIYKLEVKSFEIKKESLQRKIPDTISIFINNKNKYLNYAFKTYLCDTSLESFYIDLNDTNQLDEMHSCLLIKDNKIKIVNMLDEFTIAFFPNYENPNNRKYNFENKLHRGLPIFKSKKITRNNPFTDINIEIDFEPSSISYVELKDEIFLFEEGKIIHGGEEYIYQEDKKEKKKE